MSTRSLTHIHDGDLKAPILCTFYRQSDGYPEGIGIELADFLKPLEVINGIGHDTENKANGMGCLAAQVVKQFKDSIGDVYISHPGAKDCGEEYVYHIYCASNSGGFPSGKVNLRCEEPSGQKLYDGLAGNFNRWAKKPKD